MTRPLPKDVTQLACLCATCSAATAGARLQVSPPYAWMTFLLLSCETISGLCRGSPWKRKLMHVWLLIPRLTKSAQPLKTTCLGSRT